MPEYDGTGPQGLGPMTGRGVGPCGKSYGRRSWFNRGNGCVFGRRSGRGFGFFRDSSYNDPEQMSKADQKKMLKEELKNLEEEKKEIENELNKMS